MTAEFGAGFSYPALTRMIRFANARKLESDHRVGSGQLPSYFRVLRAYSPVFDPCGSGGQIVDMDGNYQRERAPGEAAPIGLILCASADAEQVELLQLDAKSIRVSEYLTELPPLPLLRSRLHQAIEHARERAARRFPAAAKPAARKK